jgi:cell wall-associated NlpC family hydrolase
MTIAYFARATDRAGVVKPGRPTRAWGGPAGLAIAVLASAWMSACASAGGAVPRPFPAPIERPPSASAPVQRPDQPPDVVGVEAPALAAAPVADADAAAVLATALALRGVPYRNGGSDLAGFDCSGFTQYVFAQHALALPREVKDQFEVGQRVSASKVRPGDLLFFATTSRHVSHVAIALDGDMFVHAPSSNGVVRVEHLSAEYWRKRFLGVRRVLSPAN